MKLDAVKFGLASGIVFGAGMLLLGIASWLFDYGTAMVTTIASAYVGYGPNLGGSLVGAAYGFIDGFIGLWLIALIYNKLVGK